MDSPVLVAGGIGAEYIVIAGQNGVEDDAGNGGDGRTGYAPTQGVNTASFACSDVTAAKPLSTVP